MADQNFTEPDAGPSRTQERRRARQEWIAIGAGLSGLLSIMAVILALVSLGSDGNQSGPPAVTTLARAHAKVAPAPAPVGASVKLKIKTDEEHGKRGPDGQWHDAFLGGDFTVKAGQTVTVTVSNYDDAPHSFTSPALGVNVKIPGGSAKTPHTITFRFKAPSTPGAYQWFCALPCDPWAMAHDGYMRGHVTVTA